MHALIVAPGAVMHYHFETELEIAQRHLDAGDQVTFVVCNAELLSCEANARHEADRCVGCIGRRQAGLRTLSGPVRVEPLLRLTEANRAELRTLDVSRLTREGLLALNVGEFDAGWALQSTLTSVLLRSDFSLDEHRDLLRAMLLSSVAVYRSVQNLLDELPTVDRLYVFNGRFATVRAVMRAAQGRKVPVFIHERGSSFEKFELYDGHTPHDLDYVQDEIRRAWEKADPQLREMVGASFFADRITGSQSDWFSFVKKQDPGRMPDGWQDGANNVVIFTSSTDDIDALRDMLTGTIYDDQYTGIDRIIASAKDRPGLRLFIRIHPRSARMPEIGAKKLMTVQQDNVTVIPADSPISTYAIMRKASRVVSFGSTTGIEATFWGIPSILGFRSFFDGLGSTYNPRSHEEMMQLLEADLTPKDRRGALMYGHYQKTFGMSFRHFQPTGLVGGTFKDVEVKPTMPLRAAGVLLRLPVLRDASRSLHLRLQERKLLGA